MKRRYQRRRTYLAAQRKSNRRALIIYGTSLVLLLLIGRYVLVRFDIGNTVKQTGATVTLEQAVSSNVRVAIDGNEYQNAEPSQKIYPGDQLVTGDDAYARLLFFDESELRLDELSSLLINRNQIGTESSNITLKLMEGNLWLETPSRQAFSGVIKRTVQTPNMTLQIPSGTKMLIGLQSIVVYQADGLGVSIDLENSVIPVVVGEGQRFTLPPEKTEIADPYTYRKPLDPLAVKSPFVVASQNILAGVNTELSSPEDSVTTPIVSSDVLTIITPEDNIQAESSTVLVSGVAGNEVKHLRVNGYATPIAEDRSFSLELTLPDEDSTTISVVALAEGDQEIATRTLTVTRDIYPPESPSVTVPVATGETYTTNETRVTLSGRAPRDAVGIMVNDYRLQLYEAGSTIWSYLAATTIDNYHPGENIYNVYSIDASGNKSAPASITIVLDLAAEEGTVSSDESDAPLRVTDPSDTGSLKIVSPTHGQRYEADKSAFLITGSTSAKTASIWVNDYRLRLYESGSTSWTYLADTNIGTLKRGRNSYQVVALDSQGSVIDQLTYVVDFAPEGGL